jgi:hypothetical protein
LELLDITRNLPLVTAAVWFVLVGFQVYRDRVHTWTESFFLAGAFFAGLYALSDWFFFNAVFISENPDLGARLAAIMSFTSLTLTGLFLFLFTLVYVGKMRPWYYVFVALAVVVLILLWLPNSIIVQAGGTLYFPTPDPAVFLIFLVVLSFFGGGGAFNLYRIHRIVREYSPALARRSLGLFFVFVATLVLGLSTNGLVGETSLRTTVTPPFSTLLVFVAGATLVTLYPGSGQRISVAIRRFQARRYSIKAAFLTYRDGTLIASKVQAGEVGIDRDLFGATLDVIQNFMRTSFPLLRGKSLRTIKHGDYSLIIERADFTYLTVVLGGEESDQLRRQMRDLLLEFEANNKAVLAKWRGIPEQAAGVDKMLDAFFIVEEAPGAAPALQA